MQNARCKALELWYVFSCLIAFLLGIETATITPPSTTIIHHHHHNNNNNNNTTTTTKTTTTTTTTTLRPLVRARFWLHSSQCKRAKMIKNVYFHPLAAVFSCFLCTQQMYCKKQCFVMKTSSNDCVFVQVFLKNCSKF